MAAIITDQLRILNAKNFVNSVRDLIVHFILLLDYQIPMIMIQIGM